MLKFKDKTGKIKMVLNDEDSQPQIIEELPKRKKKNLETEEETEEENIDAPSEEC